MWYYSTRAKEGGIKLARQVKCVWCGGKSDKDVMLVAEEKQTGKRSVRKYCHQECFDLYQQDKAFKEAEQKALDELVEVIKRIHCIPMIPQKFYPYLQQLRNGSIRVRNTERRYKKGFEYDLIAEAYKYCEPAIHEAKSRIVFDSLFGELRYGLAIVSDKIMFVKKRNEKIKNQMKQIEKHIESSIEDFGVEVKFKKKKASNDISDFLD